MFLWGISWPTSKILTAYGQVEVITFGRFAVVFLSLLPLAIFIKGQLIVKRSGWLSLVAASVLLAFYNFLFFSGLNVGLAGAGGVLVTTVNPVFAYLIGLIISKKVLTRRVMLGLSFGLIAGFIQVEGWNSMDQLLQSGNIYFLTAALVWAILSKITSQSTQYGSNLGFSIWLYGLTTLIMFVYVDKNAVVQTIGNTDLRFWLNMGVSAILSMTVATTVYFYATRILSAEKASSYIFLVPVTAALSAMILLDEPLKWTTIVGGVLGIGAVILLNKK
ncbi:MAG: DMT family transporter [Cyclobacteriaceae bacterium]